MYLVHDLLSRIRYKLSRRKVKRYALEQWLILSDIHSKIQDAADTKNFDGVSDSLIEYVSAAVGYCPQLNWLDFCGLFTEIIKVNNIDDRYPILKPSEKKQEKKPWEYFGRSKYFWIHILGKSFGWTKEYILNLDIDDAVALLQEIEISEQLDREFRWDLSEIAYSYDTNTKTSKHNPLPRPDWMMESPAQKYLQRKHSKPPISMMPVGNVQSLDAQS